MVLNDKEKLNDVQKLSPHVTRVLGQNPGMMTLQGTNSYILQPPSNPNAPLILIDTSSPHTAQQYVDCLLTHLHHLALEEGTREVHFESSYAAASFKTLGLADNPGDDEATKQEKAAERDRLKANVLGERMEDGRAAEIELAEYGPTAKWASAATQARKLPVVEHIILTHRHLDHVGALPTLLSTLKEHGNPPPKIWKLPNPDEIQLASDDRDRFTTDAALLANLPNGTYTPFSPFQPFHPVMPGLMISIIDPAYRHLLKHDKEGKPKWNDVPEIARVSVRCWKTPGHTQDSISLVLCEGDKGIFTGDTVLGSGTTIFTDLSAYMSSLKLLLAMKPSVLYPAHGPHIVGVDKAAAHINEYITHRQQREDQLLAVLKEVSSARGVLASKLREYSTAILAERDAKVKHRVELLSGKPYDPKARSADVKGGDKAKTDADNTERTDDKGKEDSTPAGEASAQEPDPYAVFEGLTALTVPLLCRLVYQTEDEKKIWAAGKPTLAHLEKLLKEGKVKKAQVNMPKIIDFEVKPAEVQDAWEAIDPAA